MKASIDVVPVETDTHILTQKAAMKKEDLLSFCHYYHGEVKCPFDSENERTQGLFWMFEELFVRHSLNDPTFFEGYKQEVARYIENHPGISNDLTNFNMETISKKGEK